MTTSVEANTTASSPSIERSTNLADPNGHAIRYRFRLPSYDDWNDIWVLEGTATNAYIYHEADSGGSCYIAVNNGPGSSSFNLWTDSYTGWADFFYISDSTGIHCYVRKLGGSWTNLGTLPQATFTEESMNFSKFPSFINDTNGPVRYGVMEVIDNARPGGAADLAEAVANMQAACDYRTQGFPGEGLFYNDCTAAGTVEDDGSQTADDFTKNGTWTTETDDPGFDYILQPAAIASGESVPGPEIIFGQTLQPNAVPTAEAVPSPNVAPEQFVQPAAIASGESVPGPTLVPEGVTLQPGTIPTAESVPGPTVHQEIQPSSVPSAESVPTPTVSGTAILASPVPSAESFERPVVLITGTLLSASADDRYFVDQNGAPHLVIGDAAWSAFGNLTSSELDTYLANRQGKGVNAIIVNLIEGNFSADPPNNTDGDGPYTGTMFQSSENEAYWDWIDRALVKCLERGITCFVHPAYIGNVDAEGLGAEVNAASVAQMQAYADFLVARYENFDNLVWIGYGDREAYNTKVDALMARIAANDSRHTLLTTQYARPKSSYEPAGSIPTYVSAMFLYAAENRAHVEADGGWAQDAGPCFLGEARYENYPTTGTPINMRRQTGQALASGSLGGVFYGNEYVWGFDNGLFDPSPNSWTDYLNDTGLTHMLNITGLLASLRFHTLVTEQQTTDFVTAGRGVYASDTWVSASKTADGTIALMHIPGGGQITVDMSQMAGQVTARYYDPTNNSFTNVPGQPFDNSGTRNFNPGTDVGNNFAGDPDWFLLLEANLTIEPNAIASGESVPGPSLQQDITPAIVPSGESVPNPSLAVGGVTVQPPAIASAESVPGPELVAGLEVQPSLVGSAESVPGPTVTTGGVTVQPSAVASGEAVPGPTMAPGGVNVVPDPVATSEILPAPIVAKALQPDPIGTSETVFQPSVAVGRIVEVDTITTSESVPGPTLAAGGVSVQPGTIATQESVPQPAVQANYQIQPGAITTQESVPQPTLQATIGVAPGTIGTQESIPQPSLSVAGVNVVPDPITTQESVPQPSLYQLVGAGAVPSAEVVPDPILLAGGVSIQPDPTATAEAVPSVTVFFGSELFGVPVELSIANVSGPAAAIQNATPIKSTIS